MTLSSFWGILYTINLSTGIIVSISSVVVEIVSTLAFKFHGDANDRLDRLSREVYIVEQTRLSMEYIIQISSPEARDAAIADLVRRLQASSLEIQSSEGETSREQ